MKLTALICSVSMSASQTKLVASIFPTDPICVNYGFDVPY